VKWPIVLAMKTLAGYVREHADHAVRRGARSPAATERAVVKAEIEGLREKIVELAEESRRRLTKYKEFEGLLTRLHKLGIFPTEGQVSAVAHALHHEEKAS
jgi:hypothetical protein